MAWGGNSEKRDEGDDVEDAEEELDEAVSFWSFQCLRIRY
jgi:hypothetical protein